MKRRYPRIVSFFLAGSLFLGACGSKGGPTPTLTPDVPGTEAAQTVLAHSSQFNTPGPTKPVVKLVTATPLTPAPGSTTVKAATNTPGGNSFCDKAEFLKDVTIPDDTDLPAGAGFTKTWRVRNAGTCTWSTAYKLVFDHGDAMGGPASIPLPSQVTPGETVDLTVNLVAPSSNGTYQGFWILKNNSGDKFGLDSSANSPLWVKIKVTNADIVAFAVTSVQVSVDNPTYSGSCTTPHGFTFSASITASAAGTVIYRWLRSDGQTVVSESVTFNDAGTQTVRIVWSLGSPGYSFTGWRQMYIDQPNHQEFGRVDISINCNP